MAIGEALTAPTGVQNQMVGQPSRVPGYSQGLGQAPGQMALPPEPMPIGRPTAVVGGPAYFTPQGYNAPPQPTEAFMPTDRMPDPIGQQFMRQMESPMGQQFQAQYEATQAPIREAEMAQRAEEQAAQDARFQEMMDRIAELEGQLATPTPSPVPEPEPYIPGQTPFPGIPDFSNMNLDFSNLPDFLNFDYDDVMRQYNDRMEMGEPEPIDSFLPDISDLPPMGPMGMPPAPTPAPSFMPEGMTEDFAKRVRDAGIDLSDTASYLYSPAGQRRGQSLIPVPKAVGLNPDYVPPAVPPANIPNIGAIKPVSMEKIDNNRSMIPDFGRINLR